MFPATVAENLESSHRFDHDKTASKPTLCVSTPFAKNCASDTFNPRLLASKVPVSTIRSSTLIK